MVTKSPDEMMVKQYLLGRLTEPQLEEIERRLLMDDDFGEIVGLVEDEIIEDYLEGGLAASDKEATETHFLQSPEHQSKLQFARLLRARFNKPGRTGEPGQFLLIRRRTLYWAASLAAASLLITTGTTIFEAHLRHRFNSELAENRGKEALLQADLAQERSRADALQVELSSPQIHTSGNNTGFSQVLTLMPLMRDNQEIPVVDCEPGRKRIEIRIPLVNNIASSYSVDLIGPNSSKVWSQNGIKPVSAGLGHQIAFSIPFSSVCHLEYRRQYSLILTGQDGTKPTSLSFRAP